MIQGFVRAVLERWQRAHGNLPERFYMVMCPQVEVNARGGLPSEVYELTDPRLRCRHFTGCHKPYFVVIFSGEDADERRRRVQELLSWSEGYGVHIREDAIELSFADATEDLEDETNPPAPRRSLQELLATGELVSILA